MSSSSTMVYAHDRGLQACPVCTKVHSTKTHQCDFCKTRLHQWGDYSIQKTWAWLLTSIVLYIPANLLPMMTTSFLGDAQVSTIVGGVFLLWSHGSYPIAAIIFLASVIVPIGKMVVLVWLCLSVQLQSTTAIQQKAHVYHLTELIGRWSMVDVFVVSILVALVQLGGLMSIQPGPAALAFAAMVATTMLAAMSFDSRLLWRQITEQGGSDEH